MEANTPKKKKFIQEYKAANYYARVIVIGFLLWFALILILNFSGLGMQMGNALGRIEQITLFVVLLIVCMVIGYLINKLTWKYMRINRL